MTTFVDRVIALSGRIAEEIKSVRTLLNGNNSDLTALSYGSRSNLVNSLNELKEIIDNLGTTVVTPIYLATAKVVSIPSTAAVSLGLAPANNASDLSGSTATGVTYRLSTPAIGNFYSGATEILPGADIAEGILPNISFRVTGLPVTTQVFNVTLTASKGPAVATQSITLNVAAASQQGPPLPTITLNTIADGSGNAVSTISTLVAANQRIAFVVGLVAGSQRVLIGPAVDANQVVLDPTGTQILRSTGSMTSGLLEFSFVQTLGGYSNSGVPTPFSLNIFTPVISQFSSIKLMGEFSVTTSTNVEVPLKSNGWVLRIATTYLSTTTCDPTKVSLRVNTAGFTTNGDSTQRQRTITGTIRLRKPAPDELSFTSSSGGLFDIALDDQIYVNDTIIDVTIAAGFVSGSRLEVYDGQNITRLDTRESPPPIVRPLILPFRRVSSEPFRVSFWAGHTEARNNSQVARVEAWLESSGSKGNVSFANTMTLCPDTPTGYGGIGVPSYNMTLDPTGLPDGPATICYRVFPWTGNRVWETFESWNGVTNTDAFPTLNTPTNIPCLIDIAGSHQPIYAFVNQDGTAGASAAVLPSVTFSGNAITSDPGAAGSYASMAAAAAAIRSYNALNRSHDDLSGGVIVLRSVSGSALSSNTGAYAGRVSFSSSSSFPSGVLPLEIRSASGTSSDTVRVRGVLDNGTVAPGKGVSARTLWRGITFDSGGLTSSNHTITDGGTTGSPTVQPSLTSAIYTMLVDSRVFETSNAGTAFPPIWRCGYLYHIRTTLSNPVGAQSCGSSSAIVGGLALSLGSSYINGTVASPLLSANCILGATLSGVSIAAQATGPQPPIDGIVLAYIRADRLTPTSAIVSIDANYPINRGANLCHLLVRQAGNSFTSGSAPLLRFAGDGHKIRFLNLIMQNVTGAGQRINILYGDQGLVQVEKEGSMRFSVFYSYNSKSDTFAAPEIPGSTFDAIWASGTSYTQGRMVRDNLHTVTAISAVGTTITVTTQSNHGLSVGDSIFMSGFAPSGYNSPNNPPTSVGNVVASVISATQFTYVAGSSPAANTTIGTMQSSLNSYWQCPRDVPSVYPLTSTPIPLSDTTYWTPFPAGSVITSFGKQPLRTGNWKWRHSVGSFGNIASTNAGGDNPGPVSWYGDYWGSQGSVGVSVTSLFVRDSSATGNNTFSDLGDYTPSASSPLRNRIRAGAAPVPFDLAGVAISNLGTGSAGALQPTS